MTEDNGKGSFSADIPQSAVDDALEAVEKTGQDEGKGGVVVPISAASASTSHAAPADADSGASAAPELSECDRLRAELELSQEKGRETYEKLKEEHDRFLRAVADLDNYKKRAARERDEMQKFAVEKLVRDLLPVVDNLDRALGAAAADDPLAGGVRLVLKVLEEALGRHGVKAFSALGEPFDPRLHEAVMSVSSDAAPGTVVVEHGRGFTLNDRLVRPAMVGVAAPPAEAASAQGTGEK